MKTGLCLMPTMQVASGSTWGENIGSGIRLLEENIVTVSCHLEINNY